MLLGSALSYGAEKLEEREDEEIQLLTLSPRFGKLQVNGPPLKSLYAEGAPDQSPAADKAAGSLRIVICSRRASDEWQKWLNSIATAEEGI